MILSNLASHFLLNTLAFSNSSFQNYSKQYPNLPLVVKFIRPSSTFATNQHRFTLAAGLLILVCRLITLWICEVLIQVSWIKQCVCVGCVQRNRYEWHLAQLCHLFVTPGTRRACQLKSSRLTHTRVKWNQCANMCFPTVSTVCVRFWCWCKTVWLLLYM